MRKGVVLTILSLFFALKLGMYNSVVIGFGLRVSPLNITEKN